MGRTIFLAATQRTGPEPPHTTAYLEAGPPAPAAAAAASSTRGCTGAVPRHVSLLTALQQPIRQKQTALNEYGNASADLEASNTCSTRDQAGQREAAHPPGSRRRAPAVLALALPAAPSVPAPSLAAAAAVPALAAC